MNLEKEILKTYREIIIENYGDYYSGAYVSLYSLYKKLKEKGINIEMKELLDYLHRLKGKLPIDIIPHPKFGIEATAISIQI